VFKVQDCGSDAWLPAGSSLWLQRAAAGFAAAPGTEAREGRERRACACACACAWPPANGPQAAVGARAGVEELLVAVCTYADQGREQRRKWAQRSKPPSPQTCPPCHRVGAVQYMSIIVVAASLPQAHLSIMMLGPTLKHGPSRARCRSMTPAACALKGLTAIAHHRRCTSRRSETLLSNT
jgi:hypothetical protein